MLAKKQTVLFFLFICLCLAVVVFSFFGHWDGGVYRGAQDSQEKFKSMQESYFKKAQYYLIDNERPTFQLTADELTINSTIEKIFFIKPIGFAFNDARDRIDYEGQHGFFDQRENFLTLERDTIVKMNNAEASSQKLTYDFAKDRIHLKEDVKTRNLYEEQGDWIYLDSQEAFFWTETKKSRYIGDVSGEIKRKRVYEDSLSFKSHELLLDMKRLKADLNENVVMKKRRLTATSRRGEIFLENYNKKLKYFALYDDVKVVEKVMLDGKFIDRKAFSEKLEGLPSENKIILTGYPKVYQVNDVIKGNKIVLRENTEVVEVDDANTKFKVE